MGVPRRERVAAVYGANCVWCHRWVPVTERTVEHMVPVSHGGGNHMANLRLACWACNQDRGTTPAEIWGAAVDKAIVDGYVNPSQAARKRLLRAGLWGENGYPDPDQRPAPVERPHEVGVWDPGTDTRVCQTCWGRWPCAQSLAVRPTKPGRTGKRKAQPRRHQISATIHSIAGDAVCDVCARPWPCPASRGITGKAARPIVRPAPRLVTKEDAGSVVPPMPDDEAMERF